MLGCAFLPLKETSETSYGIQYVRPSVRSRSIWPGDPLGVSGVTQSLTPALHIQRESHLFTSELCQQNGRLNLSTQPCHSVYGSSTETFVFVFCVRPVLFCIHPGSVSNIVLRITVKKKSCKTYIKNCPPPKTLLLQMYGLLVIIRKGAWSCEDHPQIIFTLILHSKIYFKININLLLYEGKMHLSFPHPFSKQLILFGVTGEDIGQDTPWTSHHFITKLRHIQTNKHIHTLPSSVAPPNDTHCLLNWES